METPITMSAEMSSTANACAAANACATEECSICCEPYNKSNRARIVCEYGSCNYKACIGCTRTYLLSSTNEAHCMECKQAWSPKFLLILKKNWMADTYRTHREKLLCDVELSKIAETMPNVEFYKNKKRVEATENEVRKQLMAEERELVLNYNLKRREITQKIIESRARTHAVLNQNKEAAKEEKKVFFMSCPAMDCKGMLSTQYKCGLCAIFACPDCHEIIGLNKTDEHTCDPNDVASAIAIKKETRQCPGCHNRIYRVEGCSQMWCTGCHTAFDWNTGKKVVSERLHNPHWLEYQRGLNNGQAPRAPGDVPCGGLCGYNEMSRVTLKITDIFPELRIRVREIYRFLENVVLNNLRTTREKVQALRDFEVLRLDYIIGDLTRAEMSAKIYNADKDRQKNTEMLNVYELLSAVGIDFFRLLIVSKNTKDDFEAEVREKLAEYNKLRIYCNGLFATISNTYAMTVPYINKNWYVISKKFNSKTLAKLLNPPARAGASAAADADADVGAAAADAAADSGEETENIIIAK